MKMLCAFERQCRTHMSHIIPMSQVTKLPHTKMVVTLRCLCMAHGMRPFGYLCTHTEFPRICSEYGIIFIYEASSV